MGCPSQGKREFGTMPFWYHTDITDVVTFLFLLLRNWPFWSLDGMTNAFHNNNNNNNSTQYGKKATFETSAAKLFVPKIKNVSKNQTSQCHPLQNC
jgi:hypothetical protein